MFHVADGQVRFSIAAQKKSGVATEESGIKIGVADDLGAFGAPRCVVYHFDRRRDAHLKRDANA